MAQRALVTQFTSLSGTANLNEMKLRFHLCLLEERVPTPYENDLEVITPWADTLAQIKSRISAAILAEAAANGYTTLTANDIIMPQVQKG